MPEEEIRPKESKITQFLSPRRTKRQRWTRFAVSSSSDFRIQISIGQGATSRPCLGLWTSMVVGADVAAGAPRVVSFDEGID